MIYFDHAATSFPKPKAVIEAVRQALETYAANPGRGTHALAEKAASVINDARREIALFFGLNDRQRVFFYQNATMALNQAIRGFPLKKGDHVIASSYEHNSIRRPLELLKKEKIIDVSYLHVNEQGGFEYDRWLNEIRPNTKLIAVTHASNLTGMIMPVEEIGQLARKKGIAFLVDASQTAGILPIDMEKMNIDLLAFAGHKGLLGPQGTGALLVRKGIELTPLIVGGTGSHSEARLNPDVLPDKFESGTLNTPGIAGLLAGIREVKRLTVENVFKHEAALAAYCIERLETINKVTVYGPKATTARLGVVAFEMEGIDCHELAMILDQHYNIAVRSGIHCTPLAHQSLGTIEKGLVRASFGITNTKEEVERFISAIKEIKEIYIG